MPTWHHHVPALRPLLGRLAALPLLAATLLLGLGEAHAQLEVNNADEPPFDPVRLIEDVFLGEGVDVVNIQFDGPTGAIGHFKGGTPAVGLEEGIILTTGRVETAGAQYGVNSPSNLNAVFDNNSTVVDANLAQASTGDPTLTGGISNVSRYTITFVPKGDRVKFRYVFASEEYPEFVCSNYNDIFGFFIDGPGIAGPYERGGINIATVPGTNLPVSINTINPGTHGAQGAPTGCDASGSLAHAAFYVDNTAVPGEVVFDGMTTVLTAEASVIPCETYTMQLALGDVTDESYDSGVFLEAKSFSTPTLDVEVETLSLAGEVAEGCEPGEIVFTLNEALSVDRVIAYTVGGTATPGVDYAALTGTVTIPAGALEARIPVNAFQDGVAEPLETIEITVQVDPCTTETVAMKLVDRSILPVPLVLDTTVCAGEPVQLDATIPVTVDQPTTFTNNAFELITQHDVSYYKPITVTGINPIQLRGGLVLEVCLNINHNNTEDLDLYLYSPDGKYIELSTDNGGANAGGYDQVCFRSDAIDPIDQSGATAPLSGSFLPEGDWSSLWNNTGANANGDWVLQIIDDTNSFGGAFLNWSITFAPVYEVVYEWSPTAGLDCTDCPSPTATTTTTTTYTVTATDSYGCTETVNARVAIFDDPAVPAIVCQPAFDQLAWTWRSDDGASEFLVSIDGGAPVSVGTDTSYTATGLGSSQTVSIEVTAVGTCNDATASTSCTTQNCGSFGLSAAATDATCFGADNGSVVLTAAGGVSPWTYTLDGSTNQSGAFGSLAPGSYTATVVDDNGCSGSASFTISEPAEIRVNMSIALPASCGTPWRWSADVQGDTTAYTFTWNDGQVGARAFATTPGIYTVTATDANGCTGSSSFEHFATSPLSASYVVEDASCDGAADGAIRVSADGTITGFEYSIGGAFQSSGDFPNLAAGSYTVTARDQIGCTIDTVIVVEAPAAVAVVIATADDASCFGESDGRLVLGVSGGTAPYSFAWSDGSTDAELLAGAGTYTATVTDANGCVGSASGTIGEPGQLTVALGASPAACSGQSNGELVAGTLGGRAPFSFAWSDGVTSTDSLRSDVPQGTYTVTVTDANGCVTASPTARVDEPAPLGASHTTQPVGCAGAATGAIDLTPFGGTAPYTYIWNDGDNAEDRTDLAAGTYRVSITDAQGCLYDYDVTLDAPDPLSVTLTPTHVSCFGFADGRITSTPVGGLAPYFYEWTGPGGYAFFGEDPTMLDVGDYTLEFRDSYGCTYTEVVTITQPSSIALATVPGDTICFGASNGAATVNVTGGTSPFIYEWDNGELGDAAAALDAGIHTVEVTDANGCVFSETVDIVALDEMVLTLDQTGVACFSDSNGVAELVGVAYGASTRPVTSVDVTWDNDATETDLTYDSLGGTQEVVVLAVDARGCTGAASITIASPAQLRADAIRVADLTCYESADGQATVQVAGGTAGYTFAWLDGTAATASQSPTDFVAGTHAVEVTDANGCVDTTEVTLRQPDSLAVNFTIAEVNCHSRTSGEISADASGGTLPYTYNWADGPTGAERDGLRAGDYVLEVVDDQGCTKTLEATVETASEVTLDVSAAGVTCHGDEDGSLSLAAAGGNGPHTYSVTGVSWNRFGDFRYLPPGDYWALAQDRDGCPSDTAYITVPEPGELTVTVAEEVTVTLGDETALEATATNAAGDVDWLWTPDDETLFGCTTCATTTLRPTFQGFVRVHAIDANGCEAEGVVRVRINKEFQVLVPTGFTPNDDGENDRLLVHGKTGTRVLEFAVFDRWGDLVHVSEDFLVNDADMGWDGRIAERNATGGVYLWKARVRYLDGIETTLTGQTTLIR